MVKSTCRPISPPWSQVMVLTNLDGRVRIAFFMASLTDKASLPAPRCKSSV